jgi:hypothetical protein
METSDIFVHGIDYAFLYSLPIADVLNMCQINKHFNNLCNDEYYWEYKLKLDHPEYFNYKIPNLTYKETYLSLVKDELKFFPVKYDKILLGYVCLQKTDTIKKTVFLINQLYNNIIPIHQQLNDIYIHVILKHKEYSLTSRYLPILLDKDYLVSQYINIFNGSLWNNCIGFEFLQGSVQIIPTRRPGEVDTIIITLPNTNIISSADY